MKFPRFPWSRPAEPAASPTLAQFAALHPVFAAALRDQGRAAEAARARGVYAAASMVRLEPLLEQMIFNGTTTPEEAAVRQVRALQSAPPSRVAPPLVGRGVRMY